MRVSDLMERSPVTVAPEDSLRDAARLLRRANVGALPVVTSAGTLKGILTDRDIVLRCLAAGGDPDRMRVRDCMTKEPVSVSADDPAEQAAALMAANGVRRLPALEGGNLAGMVSLGDLSRVKALRMEAAKALTEISLGVRRLSGP
jgi:CBS domain-containing protein